MSTCDVREWVPADGDSRCEDCHHAYRPWFTDNVLWNQVMGGEGAMDDPGGNLCPACFMRRTEAQHGFIVWRVVPTWRKPTSAPHSKPARGMAEMGAALRSLIAPLRSGGA